MGEWNRPEPSAGELDRIAAPLRAEERLSSGFEDRLLSRVRAERIQGSSATAAKRRNWWVSARVVRRTPLASMLMAAGFAAAVALSTATFSRRTTMAPAPGRDTVHLVRFVYVDSSARRIAVVGDFNGWQQSATPLFSRGDDGLWTATVPLPPGHHEYAFVIDGGRWVADPLALTARDEFGTLTSVVNVSSTDAIEE